MNNALLGNVTVGSAFAERDLDAVERIVVVRVFLQYTDEMSLIQDEEPVQTRLTYCADPAFRNGIGCRCSNGDTDDFNPF